jgi:hypothetical protein
LTSRYDVSASDFPGGVAEDGCPLRHIANDDAADAYSCGIANVLAGMNGGARAYSDPFANRHAAADSDVSEQDGEIADLHVVADTSVRYAENEAADPGAGRHDVEWQEQAAFANLHILANNYAFVYPSRPLPTERVKLAGNAPAVRG